MAIEDTSAKLNEKLNSSGSSSEELNLDSNHDSLCIERDSLKLPDSDETNTSNSSKMNCLMFNLPISEGLGESRSSSVLDLSHTNNINSINQRISAGNESCITSNNFWSLSENISYENNGTTSPVNMLAEELAYLQEGEDAFPLTTEQISFKKVELSYSFKERTLFSLDFKNSLEYITEGTIQNSAEYSDENCGIPESTSESDIENEISVSNNANNSSRNSPEHYSSDPDSVTCERLENYNRLKIVQKSLRAATLLRNDNSSENMTEEITEELNNNSRESSSSSDEEIANFYLDTAFDYEDQMHCLDEDDAIDADRNSQCKSQTDGANINVEKCRNCRACKKIISQNINSQQEDEVHLSSDADQWSNLSDTESKVGNKNVNSSVIRKKKGILKRLRSKPQFMKRNRKKIFRNIFCSKKFSKNRFRKRKRFSKISSAFNKNSEDSTSVESSSVLGSEIKTEDSSPFRKEFKSNIPSVSMDEVLNALLLMPSYLEKLECANLIPVYDEKIEELKLFLKIVPNEAYRVESGIFNIDVCVNSNNITKFENDDINVSIHGNKDDDAEKCYEILSHRENLLDEETENKTNIEFENKPDEDKTDNEFKNKTNTEFKNKNKNESKNETENESKNKTDNEAEDKTDNSSGNKTDKKSKNKTDTIISKMKKKVTFKIDKKTANEETVIRPKTD